MTTKIVVTIKLEGDVYFLSGPINEHADFSKLKTAKSPLRLDLRGVSDISSVGTRRWLTFLDHWGKNELEFHGCPPTLVGLLNSVPHALGQNRKRENVRSVMVPYSCASCNSYMELELMIRSLVVKKGVVVLTQVPCVHCGEPANAIPDPEDYFAWLTAVDE
jgi:hypothetical protein